MSKTYNWAVLGCGRIARKFCSDLKLLPQARLYAAASRDLTKAEEFSNEVGFEKAYGSYDEMLKDPNVDIVYIATPHSFHKEHTLLCLNNKKAVLCEKAFAMNKSEAEEMIACAKENNTFLMEAFWTMFQPSFQKAMEILKSEELGKIKGVRSDFAFKAPFVEEKRLYNSGLVVLIISREFFVTGLRLIASAKGEIIAASKAGKHKTVSQMLTILLIILCLIVRDCLIYFEFSKEAIGLYGYWMEFGVLISMLITILFTVVSGFLYVYENMELIKE